MHANEQVVLFQGLQQGHKHKGGVSCCFCPLEPQNTTRLKDVFPPPTGKWRCGGSERGRNPDALYQTYQRHPTPAQQGVSPWVGKLGAFQRQRGKNEEGRVTCRRAANQRAAGRRPRRLGGGDTEDTHSPLDPPLKLKVQNCITQSRVVK